MTDVTPVYEGGCQCGAIRYAAQGLAKNLCFCHCESCRRSAGAPGVPWATFKASSLRYRQGSLTEFASSAHVLRGFCNHCGTLLTYWHDARPDEIDITIASLDDAEALRPEAHIWMQDRLSWEIPGDGLPQFDTVRDHGA